MSTEPIGSDELVRRSGISFRQCDYWTTSGLLRTVDVPNPGSGHARAYPLEELFVAAVAKRLIDAGVRAVQAVQYARAYIEQGRPVTLAEGLLTVGAA